MSRPIQEAFALALREAERLRAAAPPGWRVTTSAYSGRDTEGFTTIALHAPTGYACAETWWINDPQSLTPWVDAQISEWSTDTMRDPWSAAYEALRAWAGR